MGAAFRHRRKSRRNAATLALEGERASLRAGELDLLKATLARELTRAA